MYFVSCNYKNRLITKKLKKKKEMAAEIHHIRNNSEETVK